MSVRRSGCAVVLLTATLLLVSRRDYVPMWDGWIYAQCMADVGRLRFALASLRCADHISYSSMAFYGALQLLSPGSYALILLAGALLWALAFGAVLRITELAFPGRAHDADRLLVTALATLNPAVLAAVVQPNIDLAMLPAFLWGVAFVARRQWTPLVLVGTALVLAKETGVVLYSVLVFSFAVAVVMPGPTSTRSPIRTLRKLVPLLLPVAVFAAVLVDRVLTPHTSVFTAAGTTDMPILYQFLVPRIDPYFRSYVAIIFVLSFAWIPALILAADLIVGVVRKARHEPPRPLPGAKRRLVRFLMVLGIVTMYALTRYSSYANTRYLLPVFALLPLMMYAGIVRFALTAPARRTVLGTLAVLLLVSAVRTIDPVSRWLWGTFRFGDRSMLRMTSITRECCGAGQDQLAYSLQFTALSALLGDITSAEVHDSIAIVVPARLTWQTVNALDSASRRPTLEVEHAFTPAVLGADTLNMVAALPEQALYVAMPNGDVDRALSLVRASYDVGPPMVARRGSYSVAFYPLVRRPPGG
jgi:hypothetical protein